MFESRKQNDVTWRSQDVQEMPAAALAQAGFGRAEQNSGAEDGFNPMVWFYRAMQYRKLIGAMVGFGLLLGLLVTMFDTPIYQATTGLEITAQSARAMEDLQVMREQNDSRALLTARERLTSYGLAQRVAFDLSLTTDYAFLASNSGISIAGFLRRIFRIDNTAQIRKLPFAQREAIAISKLRAGLTVRPVAGTNILSVIFRDPSASWAMRISDQFAKSYIEQRIDVSGQTASNARQFMEDQVGIIRQKLLSAEEELLEYAREKNISFASENTTIETDKISEANTAIFEAEKQRYEYERLVKFIDEGRGGDIPIVADNTTVTNLRNKISEMKSDYQEKLSTLKPAYPEMRALETKISEMERQLTRTVRLITDSIRLKYAELQSREERLRLRGKELEGNISNFQDKNIKYTILKREVDSFRSQYQSMINKVNELGIGSELKSPSAAIANEAVYPMGPASPILALNLAIAFVVSSILSIIAVYVLEKLNNTFRAPEQIESELGLPLLGLLPIVQGEDMRAAIDNHSSPLSEAYRSLRTAMQFTSTDNEPRVILVTSTEPAEGKSTTSYKLAVDFAALGLRVAIVDCDLRKPSMHRHFHTDHAVGLTSILANVDYRHNLQDVLKPTRYPNLTFISAGPNPPNPADLLSSERMALFLSACRKHFDVVILDAPPVIGLADAPILSRLADGTLLVVSSQKVSPDAARSALRRLKISGGVILGAAMTKFSTQRFDYNYSYSYMNYGYYSYGGDDQAKLESRPNDKQNAKRGGGSNSIVADLGNRLRDFADRITQHSKPASRD